MSSHAAMIFFDVHGCSGHTWNTLLNDRVPSDITLFIRTKYQVLLVPTDIVIEL